ncbi:MAG: Type 1 glutamine amidotransferase-like domain-containing protein [Actinomycetota bacterium]|nr:Type 1 glutamine amidotransferase-like domain-containing protein [Actinomycetota bacterium]
MSTKPGLLALVGGGEWREGASFDRELLERGGGDVLVLPTAAAFENPSRAVEAARAWFESLGGRANALMVLHKPEADDPANAERIMMSRFIYLSGGSPLHLRSVLKGSRVWKALVDAWRSGAVVAGSSAGAMVMCDPMVDPRGGAFTVGLGMVEQLAILPHYDAKTDRPAPHSKAHRTITLAGSRFPVACIPERTALLRDPNGSWREAGEGDVHVFLGESKLSVNELQN